MDVVEAIDAWIDEEIDDLTDDELETILEVLDVVAASRFADLEIHAVFDDDIDELVRMVGGDTDHRAHTEQFLIDALYRDSAEDSTDRDWDDITVSDADVDDTSDPATTDLLLTNDEANDQLHDDTDHDDATDHDGSTDELDDDTDHDGSTDQLHDDTDLDDPTDHDQLHDHTDTETTDHDQLHDHTDTETTDLDFLNELAEAQETCPLIDVDDEPSPASLEQAEPVVPLRPFDHLGPTFLPESSAPPVRRRSLGLSKIVLPLLMIAGLAAFAYGMLQLLNSLDSTEVASTSGGAPSAVAEPTKAPTPRPRPAAAPATAAPVDPSAPTPTPTPEPTPPPRVAIRLVTGDVMLASWTEVGGMADLTQLYDASDDSLAPAREITWLDSGLGVIDDDGDVLVVNPDARSPKPKIIYEVGDGFDAAVEITPVGDQLVIRTGNGDITISPSDKQADADSRMILWDAEEEGVAVTSISSVNDLVPFVLEDGDARMIATGSENTIFTMWLAGDQPHAFNVTGSDGGILLGVGQGVVARYQFGEFEGERLQSVWDPFATDEEPAIGYSAAGNQTAIVLGNGAIVLADDAGTAFRVWDPADTEIRAFSVAGGDTQLVVLLETGSVVRIPMDPDELIESVWDITDETLSAAVQVAVEPAAD